MINPKCPTTIEVKEKQIDKFLKFIKDQIVYGGKKYALSGQKESTDIIAETFGVDWVLGTMMKYILRYRNLQREKDLFKISAYCFIIWLQMGCHLQSEHETDTFNESKGKQKWNSKRKSSKQLGKKNCSQ